MQNRAIQLQNGTVVAQQGEGSGQYALDIGAEESGH